MSEEIAEEERIRLWREERARVAEAEKQARIEAKEAERRAQKEQEDRQREEEARKLIPTDAQLAQSEQRLQQYQANRRKALLRQFLVMVALPVGLFGLYLMIIAVPLYEARAVVAITKAGAEEDGNIGGLLGSLQGPSNLQEMFMAHEFVGSDALTQFLEDEIGLISDLSGSYMDSLRRIRDYKLLPITQTRQLRAFVESSANIQSGLLTVYVRLPDAQQAVDVSKLILERTEQQINGLSMEVFERRVELAQDVVTEAQDELKQAQLEVVQLQIKSGEADPNARIENIYLTIRELSGEAQELTSEIERSRLAANAGRYDLDRLTELRDGLEARIEEQRTLLITEPGGGGQSLNSLLTQYELAALNVNIAEQRLTAALEGLSSARQSAALGQSIFQVVVPPTVAIRPTFPNVPASLLIASVLALAVFGLFRLFAPDRTRF
ncbi:hypothetical protein ACFQDZ_23360 [Sulfitobacter pacificus]|uniref:hypothetical protein n=1 Tax=Sulfitobacter pacificus TaxID=1499314 RepID=UPI00360836C0